VVVVSGASVVVGVCSPLEDVVVVVEDEDETTET
jgi:tetrahydrodipicolinate N-succinyltransferase